MKSETRAKVLKCTYCVKEFKYESEKRRHEQSHVPQFECRTCSKKFSFVSALRRHEKQHERTERVQCCTCGGRFRDETLLKRHMGYAHRGTHKCKKCNAILNSELALRIHMKTHRPESERKFRCSYDNCSKTFNFAHHLKHHELTHTDNKPHVCMECGKRFIQLHHLKIHQRVHKPDSWLTCTVLDCKKEFTNEYALRRHIATHKTKPSKKLPKSLENAEYITEEIKDLSVNSSEIYSKQVQVLNMVVENNCQFENFTEMVDMKTLKDREEFKIIEMATAGIFETFDNNVVTETYVDETDDMDEMDLSTSNCKSVLGKCIVTEDTKTNEGCLCAQMATETRSYDFIDVVPLKNNNVTVKMIDKLKCTEKRLKDETACDTCECASICGIRDKVPNNSVAFESPELEFRSDNIIKIKDTFDIDIRNFQNAHEKLIGTNKLDLKAEVRIINSCKDILGNCIVSGDGTIGEGCLCARMIADDQQIIAQEIEDITPCPKTNWFNQ